MLDKMSWTLFEKTGDIDAYLLYIDIKNMNNISDGEKRSQEDKTRYTG